MPPVNVDELEWSETEHGAARWRRKSLGEAAGGSDLGCSLYELPPDRTSCPYHYHAGNAEAMYVLAGSGTLRGADGEHRLEPGDYVPFPAGEDGAHKVRADPDEPLRYLMVSTMRRPDVTVYPDSEKIAATADTPGDGCYRIDDAVGYWEGE